MNYSIFVFTLCYFIYKLCVFYYKSVVRRCAPHRRAATVARGGLSQQCVRVRHHDDGRPVCRRFRGRDRKWIETEGREIGMRYDILKITARRRSSDDQRPHAIASYAPRDRYAADFVLTLFVAATVYVLILSLFEVAFHKVVRTTTLQWAVIRCS